MTPVAKCHSRENGNPVRTPNDVSQNTPWIPAYAGMTGSEWSTES
jgi:hypothetical protein